MLFTRIFCGRRTAVRPGTAMPSHEVDMADAPANDAGDGAAEETSPYANLTEEELYHAQEEVVEEEDQNRVKMVRRLRVPGPLSLKTPLMAAAWNRMLMPRPCHSYPEAPTQVPPLRYSAKATPWGMPWFIS